MRPVLSIPTLVCAATMPLLAFAEDASPDFEANGLKVTRHTFPSAATVLKPKIAVGDVEIGTSAPGSNPYNGTPLAGSPFLSVGYGSVADFVLRRPASAVRLIWGTPDMSNQVVLFGLNHAYIGTIQGNLITDYFRSGTTNYVEIASTTPIYEVALEQTSNCCQFETGNQSLRYAPPQ